MGVKWQQFVPHGLGINDDSTLYIVIVPDPARPRDMAWVLVERHAPSYEAKKVAGPFPTKDAAKAAYVVLAPRYPGP